MDAEGWVSEVNELWPGQKFCIQMKRCLYQKQSPYQEVSVYESKAYGTVLMLDGIIQCTERDEASYSEMMAHVPICSLKEPPKKVLVIGGGDGGVVRELTRYSSIEAIDVAEIDKMVIDVSKQFLPNMSAGFEDPRVHVHVGDGCQFARDAAEATYDAVIIDSSDPIGPAVVLYKTPFYAAVHRCLKPGGAVAAMGECTWLHLDFIKQVVEGWGSVFSKGSVSYASICTPSYPCGQIGMIVAMKADLEGKALSPLEPPKLHYLLGREHDAPELQYLSLERVRRCEMACRYYNAGIHTAAFCLPQFASRVLTDALNFQ